MATRPGSPRPPLDIANKTPARIIRLHIALAHTHTHTRGLYLNGASRQLMLGLKNRGGRFADHTGSIGSSYHQRQPAPAASSLTPAFAVNTRSSPSLGLTHCHTPAVKHFLHFPFPPNSQQIRSTCMLFAMHIYLLLVFQIYFPLGFGRDLTQRV